MYQDGSAYIAAAVNSSPTTENVATDNGADLTKQVRNAVIRGILSERHPEARARVEVVAEDGIFMATVETRLRLTVTSADNN